MKTSKPGVAGVAVTVVAGFGISGAAEALSLTVLSATEHALYNIDTEHLGAPAPVGTITGYWPHGGPDLYELAAASATALYTFDRATFGLLAVRRSDASVLGGVRVNFPVPPPFSQTRGFDISPAGVMYGIQQMRLYTIDLETGSTALIAPITGATGVEAIAFDANGNLYAAGSPTREDPAQTLYRLDPSTAELSFVGNLAVPDMDTLTVAEDGYLYGTDSQWDEIADLFRINPYTAEVTNLGSTGVQEVNGIFGASGYLPRPVVPLPPALWLLGAGFLSYLGLGGSPHRRS